MHAMDVKYYSELLRNVVLKVVPVENLNGRKLVEGGEFCERRNGRGVDLNRNWSVDWGKKEKDYDPYEENPGTAPFSEPEAQIMRKLSKSFNPHIWVTVHSGMEALFMPYDHKNRTPDGHNSHVMQLLLEDLNHRHFNDKCLVGSGGGSVGYLAHGTTTDYMYETAKVPMTFTFEIYGDVEASLKDCFRMFNPVAIAGYHNVIEKWTAAFLTLLKIGPEWLVNGNLAVPGDGLLKGSYSESRIEGLEHGMGELQSYFRLFLLSTILLMFLFCSKISKGRRDKQIELEKRQPSYVYHN